MASETGFTIDEFRLLTCARPELSKSVIQSEMLEKYCPLDNDRIERRTISQSNAQASPLDIGSLRALPLDIIYVILDLVDLQSLTGFRAVSWGTRDLIDSIPQYKAIIQHVPDSLRALLSTEMAAHITTPDLFEALCTSICSGCGAQFGPLLDMFTCRRYCATCVSYSDDLMCTPSYKVKRELDVLWKTIHTFPSFLTIDHQNPPGEPPHAIRTSLVRAKTAIRMAKELGLRRTLDYAGAPPLYERLVRRDTHENSKYRFMPMLKIPFLDRRLGKLDWGVSCQGCRFRLGDKYQSSHGCETFYSVAGYLEHFQKCEVSQAGRKVLPEYIAPVPEDQPAFDARFLDFLRDFRT